MRDKRDGLAQSRREGAKFALQFGARDRIERAERLVHQQDGRIGGERARHAHALPLPAGELARAALREFGGVQADEREHLAARVRERAPPASLPGAAPAPHFAPRSSAGTGPRPG